MAFHHNHLNLKTIHIDSPMMGKIREEESGIFSRFQDISSRKCQLSLIDSLSGTNLLETYHIVYLVLLIVIKIPSKIWK